MAEAQRRAAKLRVVGGMERGLPWHKAAEAADTRLSRATAFRALRIVRAQGEEALQDGRHGHPHKLTSPVREWLHEYCRGAPKTPGRVVRTQIEQQVGITVSVSQINRVRAVLGVSSRPRGSGGNRAPALAEPDWREGAGSLLLLAAAHETGLIDALAAALPEDLTVDPDLRTLQSCR